MIAATSPMLLAALLLAVSFCACSKAKPSTFQNEAQWLQTIWSGDAELKHGGAPQQNPNEMQQAWNYQFLGGRDAAMNLFRSHIPPGYSLVRQTNSELSFARWDGHDSYELALTFDNSTNQTTTVSVILKSFPD
jgi:hypothetical protein